MQCRAWPQRRGQPDEFGEKPVQRAGIELRTSLLRHHRQDPHGRRVHRSACVSITVADVRGNAWPHRDARVPDKGWWRRLHELRRRERPPCLAELELGPLFKPHLACNATVRHRPVQVTRDDGRQLVPARRHVRGCRWGGQRRSQALRVAAPEDERGDRQEYEQRDVDTETDARHGHSSTQSTSDTITDTTSSTGAHGQRITSNTALPMNAAAATNQKRPTMRMPASPTVHRPCHKVV